MRARTRLGAVAVMAGVASSLAAAPARADLTKEQCIDANGKGQDALHDGKLTEARVQLQSCAVSSCPTMIRDDCTKRLDELDRLQPAIVFEAKDPSGNDLSAVKVTIDGAPLTDRLDGTPLRVDPGEHVFVFTAEGQPAVTQKLVLAERDQARRVHIVVGVKHAPRATAPQEAAPARSRVDTEAAPPTSPSNEMSTLRLLGLVSGGAGVAGLVVGSAFGVMTGSAWNRQQSDCASATNCQHHSDAITDHSTAVTDSAISTVAFVAGGVLLAAGAAMFFARGSSTEQTATALVVAPAIAPGEAWMSLHGAF